MKKITLGILCVVMGIATFAFGVWYGAHLERHLAFLEENEDRPVGQVFGVSLGYVKDEANQILVGYNTEERRYTAMVFHERGEPVKGKGITYTLAVLDALDVFRREFPEREDSFNGNPDFQGCKKEEAL